MRSAASERSFSHRFRLTQTEKKTSRGATKLDCVEDILFLRGYSAIARQLNSNAGTTQNMCAGVALLLPPPPAAAMARAQAVADEGFQQLYAPTAAPPTAADDVNADDGNIFWLDDVRGSGKTCMTGSAAEAIQTADANSTAPMSRPAPPVRAAAAAEVAQKMSTRAGAEHGTSARACAGQAAGAGAGAVAVAATLPPSPLSPRLLASAAAAAAPAEDHSTGCGAQGVSDVAASSVAAALVDIRAAAGGSGMLQGGGKAIEKRTALTPEARVAASKVTGPLSAQMLRGLQLRAAPRLK